MVVLTRLGQPLERVEALQLRCTHPAHRTLLLVAELKRADEPVAQHQLLGTEAQPRHRRDQLVERPLQQSLRHPLHRRPQVRVRVLRDQRLEPRLEPGQKQTLQQLQRVRLE